MSTQVGLPVSEQGVAAAPVVDPGRPYARSWVNVLIDRIEGLPGPTWAAYIVAAAVTVLGLSTTDWISGAPIDGIKPDRAIWALALIGSLFLIHHLDRTARGALDDFAPILAVTPAERADLEYELTVISARPTTLVLALSTVRTVEAFAFQPESEGLLGLTPVALVIRGIFEISLTTLLLVLVFHTIRQLRLVGQIHAMAPTVSLFRSAPLYAFSRLTSRTAIGLAFLAIPFLGGLTAAVTTLDYITSFSILGLILGTALLAFALPLVGMHQRMTREKQRLQAETGGRIEALVGDLHGSIDRGDLSGADGQNKALASLIAEREVVGRLSTWPWQAGTAGAVISAVLLPIALWVVTRLMERLL